jgi:hypothetical protein
VRQSSLALNREGAGSTPAGAITIFIIIIIIGRTAIGAVSRPENGSALSGLGGSTPSPSAFPEAWASWKGSVANTRAADTARRFESCCLRLSQSGVVELERRAIVTHYPFTREIAGSIPAAGAFDALVVEAGDDAGLFNPEAAGRIPPRVLTIARSTDACWSTSR